MNIHEYQAKKLFADYSIPVPEGSVAITPKEAIDIAAIYEYKVVVKAQIHAGGRGKAGGVKLFSDSKEIESFSSTLLGTNLVTAQTSKTGVPVHKVLVEKIYDLVGAIIASIIGMIILELEIYLIIFAIFVLFLIFFFFCNPDYLCQFYCIIYLH